MKQIQKLATRLRQSFDLNRILGKGQSQNLIYSPILQKQNHTLQAEIWKWKVWEKNEELTPEYMSKFPLIIMQIPCY